MSIASQEDSPGTGEHREGGGTTPGQSGGLPLRVLEHLPGSAVLVIDGELRIRLAAGTLLESRGLDPARITGSRAAEALAEVCDGDAFERACQQAIAGAERELICRRFGERACSLRFAPLREREDAEPSALVVLTEEGPAVRQLTDLEGRARDLETLAEAVSALAHSADAEEARMTVCEAAVRVTGADVAALYELDAGGGSLIVSAAAGAELTGAAVALDSHLPAATVFSRGERQYAADVLAIDPGRASPLGRAGATSAIWQPIKRSVGIGGVRGVIGVGWLNPVEPPSDRLVESLEAVAVEAALAIDRAAAVERLTGLARTDPLTSLPNRRAWDEEVIREIARAHRSGQQLSIGMIDIDDLKPYNDQWGHSAGDRLLLTAAARWRRSLRLSDLLARIGGDEFAIALPGCGLAEGVQIAETLRASLPNGIRCSIGITQWSAGESPATVVERADHALYAAKNGGRDRTSTLPPPPQAGHWRPVP